jgi:hypothetical protein
VPARRLLYLTPHRLVACEWKNGHCRLEGEFAVESSAGDFLDYLRQHAGSLFSLVTNLAEEGFQVETIPFLQAGDRDAVLTRRLGQTFLGAPLTVAVPLGHERTTRRNERVLLAALTNGNALEPWLQALRQAETRLVGIYSLPLLTPALLDKLRVAKERSIFVTVQDNSVRQSFFDKGHLHFSRLAPIPNSSISGLAQLIGSEIAKLQQYLLSQRMIGRGEALVVHVLAHPQALPALGQLILPDQLRLQTYSIAEFAPRLGLKEALEDSRAERLFLHLAATHAPRQQFAPPALRKNYRLWQTARAIQAVSAIALVGSVLFAGNQWFQLQVLREETRRHESEAAAGETRYRDIVASFPKLPLSHEHLRQVIARLQEVQPRDSSPTPILKVLGATLAHSPQIELGTLDWTAGGPLSLSKRTEGKSALADNETLLVSGTVQPGPNWTPRQLLAAFEDFLQKLRSADGYTVSVTQQPFDTASGSALKSGESAAAAHVPKPFRVSVVKRTTAP